MRVLSDLVMVAFIMESRNGKIRVFCPALGDPPRAVSIDTPPSRVDLKRTQLKRAFEEVYGENPSRSGTDFSSLK